ncbi:unnamed protein product [Rotaria sp. Silwood1]|nr:unnamed protein product [Rotaria sp. Silwood1]
MISKLEIFPNEIFINIFSYLSWDELLISLWLLNKRINSLICFIFSMKKNGIVLNDLSLTYKKFSKILLPLILNSSSLSSNIKYIYVNGINSISFDFIYQKIFYDDNNNNNKQKIPFPNLKSLYITQCLLSERLLETLSFLIQYKLNQLTLTFHKEAYVNFDYGKGLPTIISNREKKKNMYRQILCQIFSDRCQLTSLQLDINKFYSIHQCLMTTQSHLPLNTVLDGYKSYCVTLRDLYIRLDYTCFLEDLIEYVPNLEQLSVHLENLKRDDESYDENIQSPILTDGNWFNKVPKLKCFTLKSSAYNDLEFAYLKWLLNNINHVIKLEIHLYSIRIWRKEQRIRKSFIDANFIRQYCLPDKIINLRDFYFYIRAECQLSLNNIEKIINSFKIDSFFISHQWTNVKCFYDECLSYQHIFSSNLNKFQYCDLLINYPCVYDWSPTTKDISIYLDSSVYVFLEQFDKLCPNVSDITINEDPCDELIEEDKALAIVFSSIISMTVQLKYIFIDRFEWFLYIIRYAFDISLKNALRTIRHAEFRISSCNVGYNESVHIGKYLVPLLSTYMPHLQTLCLWRPDDFPWTSSKFILLNKIQLIRTSY